MSVCCECCALSGRGPCDELITRPEKSCRMWCVLACGLETSWPTLGRSATGTIKKAYQWIKTQMFRAVHVCVITLLVCMCTCYCLFVCVLVWIRCVVCDKQLVTECFVVQRAPACEDTDWDPFSIEDDWWLYVRVCVGVCVCHIYIYIYTHTHTHTHTHTYGR